MLQGMPAFAYHFVEVAPQGAAALAATLAVFASFVATGRLTGSKDPSLAALLGWSIIYLFALVSSLLGIGDLRLPLGVLLLLTVAALIFRARLPLQATPPWWSLLLAIPVLLLGSLMPSLYWDSYMHWLPNALYMFRFDHFPAVPLTDLPSVHPTYPPAIPLLIYFVSKLTGQFAEAAGPLISASLSIAAVACVNRLLHRDLSPDLTVVLTSKRGRAVVFSFAFCAVILLNPAIKWVHFWSALADPAIAVVVLVTIATWCRLLVDAQANCPSTSDSAGKRYTAFDFRSAEVPTFLLLGVLIAGLKHSGWQTAIVIVSTGMFIGIAHRLPTHRWLLPGLAVLVGSVVSTAIWRQYLQIFLPVADQFSVLPFSAWRFDMLGRLLRAFWVDAVTYRWYYGLLLIVIVVGLARLARQSTKPTQAGLMLSFAAVATLAHVACLIAAYLGTGFEEWEIARAASLQRYTTHFGFAACAVGLSVASMRLVPILLGNSAGVRSTTFVAGAAVLLILFIWKLIYPTLSLAKHYYPTRVAARAAAIQVLELTTPKESIALIGEDWSVHMANYEAWAHFSEERRPRVVARDLAFTPAHKSLAVSRLNEWMSDPGIDRIFMLNAEGLAAALGLEPVPYQVWDRDERKWTVLPIRGP